MEKRELRLKHELDGDRPKNSEIKVKIADYETAWRLGEIICLDYKKAFDKLKEL